jgi:ribonuclease T2
LNSSGPLQSKRRNLPRLRLAFNLHQSEEKMRRLICSILFFLTSLVQAGERVNGDFTAARSCDAYSSFAKGTNPGAVRTDPGAIYDLIELNKPRDYEWIRIAVPGAQPSQRWVPRDCGTITVTEGPPPSVPGTGAGQCSTPNQQDSYVLAMSWQPGFCEHARKSSVKPECTAMEEGELVVDHLTLHGLWPNRKSCGKNYGNCAGPELDLREETITRLAPWMPNFYYQTAFGAYEWNKHGKCQNLEDDVYFSEAVRAVEQINASEIGRMLAENLGGTVDTAAFFAAVARQYGAGVADNILLVCAGKGYLQELQVHLPLRFKTGNAMNDLIGGTAFKSRTQNCPKNIKIEASGVN